MRTFSSDSGKKCTLWRASIEDNIEDNKSLLFVVGGGIMDA